MEKNTEKKLLDITVIGYMITLILTIIAVFIQGKLLIISIILLWIFSILFLIFWIRILIIEAKNQLWGWFIVTILIHLVAMLFYFSKYRPYLKGKIKKIH